MTKLRVWTSVEMKVFIELENLCVGIGVSSALGTLRPCWGSPSVLSFRSTRSARNAPVQMMAMKSHPIPCLLSATKGSTDPPQTA